MKVISIVGFLLFFQPVFSQYDWSELNKELEAKQKLLGQDLVAGRVNTQLLHNYRYAGDFAADQLYRRFQEHLDREGDPQIREQLETMLLDAFSQLLVEG